MSQLSSEDVQALQQFLQAVAPVLVDRIKNLETKVNEQEQRLVDLIERVNNEKPKTTGTRGRRRTQPDVPQLKENPQALAQMTDAQKAQLQATAMQHLQSLPDAPTSAYTAPPGGQVTPEMIAAADEAFHSRAVGNPHVHIQQGQISVLPGAVYSAGVNQPQPVQQVATPPLIVDGVNINANVMAGVLHVLKQGYRDPGMIAQALQTTIPVVQAVLTLPITHIAEALQTPVEELQPYFG